MLTVAMFIAITCGPSPKMHIHMLGDLVDQTQTIDYPKSDCRSWTGVVVEQYAESAPRLNLITQFWNKAPLQIEGMDPEVSRRPVNHSK